MNKIDTFLLRNNLTQKKDKGIIQTLTCITCIDIINTAPTFKPTTIINSSFHLNPTSIDHPVPDYSLHAIYIFRLPPGAPFTGID